MVSGRRDVEMKEDIEFSDPREEAAYWKQMAEEYANKLQETQDEFDDFQEGSRELEAELEAQVEQNENRVKELLSIKQRLEQENEVLKEKLESTQNEAYVQITSLQDENAKLKAVKEEMQKYIRELEQVNDDLERGKRATVCSLEDFEQRLNQAIERNAFLENELDEKEELTIIVQRLKDESRDLKAELAVRKRPQGEKGKSFESEDKENNMAIDGQSNPLNTSDSGVSGISSPHSNLDFRKTNLISTGTSPSNGFTFERAAMTPSARISALNIVGDLLRKVGALESKLASCKTYVQEHPNRHARPAAVESPAESPRPKKQNTGRGNANLQGLVKVVV